MRLHSLLIETGDNPYPGRATTIERDYIEYSSDGGVTVYFTRSQEGVVYISFTVNSQSHITGKGNQFRVCATVLAAIRRYLPTLARPTSSTQVGFSADAGEPSRIRLYRNRIAPMVTDLLGKGWEFSEVLENNEHQFVWTRAKAVTETQLDMFNEPRVFYVLINGKLWRKKGKPVVFDTYASADKAVLSIINNHGKAAQVVDSRRWPGVINTN
jgi:hypothetical protein